MRVWWREKEIGKKDYVLEKLFVDNCGASPILVRTETRGFWWRPAKTRGRENDDRAEAGRGFGFQTR
jgi:hypothetical protein